MKLKKIESRLLGHPLFDREIPLQMQLGLPYFYQKNDRLFLHYFLHKRNYKNGMLLIYPNQYEVELLYPFQRIVRFEDSQVYGPVDTETPVCTVEAERLLTDGKILLEEMYSRADGVIEAWGRDRALLDKSLLACQKIRKKMIEEFNLDALYGG